MADGQILTLHCQPGTPSGQYVIIQEPFSRQYMTLCEVEVYSANVDIGEFGLALALKLSVEATLETVLYLRRYKH